MATLFPLALTLLAFGVRLFRLTEHSLWFDEAMSVHWAKESVARILQVGLGLVEDKHPPGYYLLLHGWMRAFGDGEVALRTLGALVGALAVPPAVRLGALLWGRRTGYLAGLLVVLLPILVWYSQEVRMFGLAATLAVAACWCLVEGLRRGGWGWWLGYALCILAGCYSYLFTAFLLPSLGLLVLGTFLARWRVGRLGRLLHEGSFQGLVAQVVVAFGFAPLAWRALQVGGAEAAPGRPFVDFLPAAFPLGVAYTVWRVPWSLVAKAGAVALFALLLLLGFMSPSQTQKGNLSPQRRGERGESETSAPSAPLRCVDGRWVLVATLFGPLLLGNLFLAVDGTVFAEARYFLPLAPFLCLGWAAGIGFLWRRSQAAGLLGTLAPVAVLFLALPALWLPENRREDWRAVAAYLHGHAQPGDVVLVHPAFLEPALAYYYQGPSQVAALFGGRLDSPEQVEAPLARLATSQAVWLVQSHLDEPDPAHWVEGWLAARFPLITEQYPAGVSLKGYATQYRLEALPEDAMPADVSFGSGLHLAGYHLEQHRLRATDDRYHPPSNWVHLTAYWTRTGPVPDGIMEEARLVDNLGQVWGLGLRRDRATWQLHPPVRWLRGEIVRSDHDINLNPVTPPGHYQIILSLLGPDGQPFPARDGRTSIVLGEVEIIP
ncbi:MAG: glycosyltransferase family 39 protein [Anaerolineae bacterium]